MKMSGLVFRLHQLKPGVRPAILRFLVISEIETSIPTKDRGPSRTLRASENRRIAGLTPVSVGLTYGNRGHLRKGRNSEAAGDFEKCFELKNSLRPLFEGWANEIQTLAKNLDCHHMGVDYADAIQAVRPC